MRDSLAFASEDRSWSLLIRHATRPDIPAGHFGNDLSITEDGRRDATEVGRLLSGRIHRLVTSPVARCVQTAEAMRLGAGARGPTTTDSVLGEPGVWIADGDAVGDAFLKHGPQEVVSRQLGGHTPPGMTPLELGVKRFLAVLFSARGEPGTIDVYVSHDAIIAPLLSAVLGVRSIPEIWPAYLEGAFLSRGAEGLDVIWRGRRRSGEWRAA